MLIATPWLNAVHTAIAQGFVKGHSQNLIRYSTSANTSIGHRLTLGTAGGLPVVLECVAGWGNTLNGQGISPDPKPQKDNANNFTLSFVLTCGGQEIYGVCSVTNQRLLLTIQNIRLDKQIIPVNLTVFSLDGMPGIPAPEAELGGAAANGSSDAIQSMQFLSMDQSLGAQAAAGGVNAAKGLFSKKVKKIKVKLKDEYPVLLKINK